MRSGELDRNITIQRRTLTQASDGSEVETWANVDARRPASMSSLDGDERYSEPEKVAKEQIAFQVRYSSNVASLSPLDRVVHPALTQAEAADSEFVPEERRIHDIVAVLEVGRREALRIITTRRVDVF